MSSLADLQNAFASFLRSPPGDAVPAPLQGKVAMGGVDAGRRLAVYKNNVYAQLIDALAATYPAVLRLVGEEFFRFAAREFVASHPATEKNLAMYGKGFHDFLAKFEPAASVPYLADVAMLEYRYLAAYHSIDARSLPADRYSVLVREGGGSRVALHPSSQLMSSQYPVSRIWELNRSDAPIDGKISIEGQSEYLLIIRPQATVEVRRLSLGAFVALLALSGGSGLPEAVLTGRQAEPEANLHEQLLSLAVGETFVEKEASSHG